MKQNEERRVFLVDSLKAAILIEQTALIGQSREELFVRINQLDKQAIFEKADDLLFGYGDGFKKCFATLASGVALLTMLGHEVKLFGETFVRMVPENGAT